MKNWAPTIGQKVCQGLWCSLLVLLNHKNGHGQTPTIKPPANCQSLTALGDDQDNRIPAPASRRISILPDTSLGAKVDSNRRSGVSPNSSDLFGYLLKKENHLLDVMKVNDLLQRPQVLLELGCGDGEAARRIALKNPGMGVIATDIFDWSHHQPGGPCYGKTALIWRNRRLPSQVNAPANLVVLRAEVDLLRYLPMRSIDTIFTINPEPGIGKYFLNLLQKESLILKIKASAMQIVILPYSREFGIMACGGCSFEHEPDWSRGLGFIMDSGLLFRKGAPVQWGVNLSSLSAYSGNSTQSDIYVHGVLADAPASPPTGQDNSHRRQ